MLYNVPGRTGQDIPDEVVLSLAESHPESFLGERRKEKEERRKREKRKVEKEKREQNSFFSK